MMNLKVVAIKDDVIFFENGIKLYSHHDQDCCENHWLAIGDLTILYKDKVLRMGTSSTHCHSDSKPFQVNITLAQANRMKAVIKLLQEQPITMVFGDEIGLNCIL